jgi:hypothetical protein
MVHVYATTYTYLISCLVTSGHTSRARGSGSHSPNLSSARLCLTRSPWATTPSVCPPWRARVMNAGSGAVALAGLDYLQYPHRSVQHTLHLSYVVAIPPRNYPPPPTGLDLMRLFPPQPQEQPLLTSLYFCRQEHQFIPQVGKDIIHSRVNSDFPPPAGGSRAVKGKELVSASPSPAFSTSHATSSRTCSRAAGAYESPASSGPAISTSPSGYATGLVAPLPGYAPHYPATMVRNAPPPVSHIMS